MAGDLSYFYYAFAIDRNGSATVDFDGVVDAFDGNIKEADLLSLKERLATRAEGAGLSVSPKHIVIDCFNLLTPFARQSIYRYKFHAIVRHSHGVDHLDGVGEVMGNPILSAAHVYDFKQRVADDFGISAKDVILVSLSLLNPFTPPLV